MLAAYRYRPETPELLIEAGWQDRDGGGLAGSRRGRAAGRGLEERPWPRRRRCSGTSLSPLEPAAPRLVPLRDPFVLCRRRLAKEHFAGGVGPFITGRACSQVPARHFSLSSRMHSTRFFQKTAAWKKSDGSRPSAPRRGGRPTTTRAAGTSKTSRGLASRRHPASAARDVDDFAGNHLGLGHRVTGHAASRIAAGQQAAGESCEASPVHRSPQASPPNPRVSLVPPSPPPAHRPISATVNPLFPPAAAAILPPDPLARPADGRRRNYVPGKLFSPSS